MERASGAWLETPSDINQNVYSLTKDGSGSFYAGTDEAVYKSTNGTEWASIGGLSNINTLEIRWHASLDWHRRRWHSGHQSYR